MALVKAGADRQVFHERLRGHAMNAWESIRAGHENPLPALLAEDPEIRRYLEAGEIVALLEVESYLGDAPSRALALAREIREIIS